MTRKAIQVNYSHWPAKNSLSEVVHFGHLVDVLQYNYDDLNGKLNDTQLYLMFDVHLMFRCHSNADT